MSATGSSAAGVGGRCTMVRKQALASALRQLERVVEDGPAGLLYDFRALARNHPGPGDDYADADANPHKNRYRDVLPFGCTRVRLAGGTSGDYINASHVRSQPGEQPPWEHIATQGPTDKTTIDFWQMVYEQGSNTVIMLTNLAEGRAVKCADYLGLVKHLRAMADGGSGDQQPSSSIFGDFKVDILACIDELPGVMHRPLRLVHQPSGASRLLDHYHLYEWADHGVPDSPRSLLSLLSALRAAPQTGPLVVHCSAGIGRTGTLIAVDAATRRLRAVASGGVQCAYAAAAKSLEDAAAAAIDLHSLVVHLRGQRGGMVQTLEQYHFCHRAVRDDLRQLLASMDD